MGTSGGLVAGGSDEGTGGLAFVFSSGVFLETIDKPTKMSGSLVCGWLPCFWCGVGGMGLALAWVCGHSRIQ